MTDFKREERYTVIKNKTGKQVECVVVEKDWPEYEIVWQMLQDRVEGRPNIVNRLREYAFHTEDCDGEGWGSCTCGLAEVLSSLEEPK